MKGADEIAKMIDLAGQRYGKLVAMKRVEDKVSPSGYKTVMWLCQCDCGNTTIVSAKNLRKKFEPTISCGCYLHSVRNDLSGKIFGRLTVLDRAPNTTSSGGHSIVRYHCICACGNKVVVKYMNLVGGLTKSCGCLQRELTSERSTTHGKSKTDIYKVWVSMKKRCYNKQNKDYKYYGEKGVGVCDDWRDDFEKFYDWSSNNGYKKGLTIDRIEVNGDYSPNNCRWVDWIVQQNNTTRNIYYFIDNEYKTIAEISRKYNINDETLRSRVKNGMSMKEALDKPHNFF